MPVSLAQFAGLFALALMLSFCAPGADASAGAARTADSHRVEGIAFQVFDSQATFAQVSDELSGWRDYGNGAPLYLEPGRTLWLRFHLDPRQLSRQDWLLSPKMAALEHVQVHTLDPRTGARWSSRPQGLLYPDQPHFARARQLAFALPGPIVAPLEVYVAVRNPSLVRIPLTLVAAERFAGKASGDWLVMGVMLGIVLVMALYNFGVFFALRESCYGYYALYVTCSLWYLLNITGVGFYYFWGDSAWALRHGSLTAASACLFFASLYIRRFLELHRYGPWLSYSNGVLLAFWALMTVIVALSDVPVLYTLMGPATIVSSLVALAMAVYLSLKRVTSAILFSIAWLVLIAGSVVFSLMLEGLLPFNPITAYAQMVGLVLELILLSFALAYRIHQVHDSRERAQEEALDHELRASRERSQRLEAQQRMLALQQGLNQRLEEEVRERTRQYQDAAEQLEQVNTRLRQLSLTDPLTQVGNRRCFDDNLALEARRAQRTQQPLAVILVDVDHFKAVNDTHGHGVGDDCLRELGVILQSVVSRPGDRLARYGGEEFAYILPDTNLRQAEALAEKTRRQVAELEIPCGERSLRLTVSLGVAAGVPTGEDGGQALVEAADNALYAAKAAGRNRALAGAVPG